MFEVSGDDITKLSDSDLRSLVARLAIAELVENGCPRSSVTAGGNQDATDGGVDVRVECPTSIPNPDFIPRRMTGFQVKKPDMPPSAIQGEMRPKGVLRNAIRELADASGAYVIVSSQGSVADKPLIERRRAMRDAITDIPNANELQTDFYDRERLATWVNKYPGAQAWVRSRSGRPIAGWSSIENWDGSWGTSTESYLFDDRACLIYEGSEGHEHLAIEAGVARLRASLQMPKHCIRLVGLSGTGKTRLIQALFEESVGSNPLESSLAIYTDYSSETNPTARDMARELIASGQRAILIIDNCNSNTHSELSGLCKGESSQVSLITVEYDVRDDEPEHTDVFRLQSASHEILTKWLERKFPEVSSVDRDRIAQFSDGNFRVARAIADTLGKGETLGSLRSRELFGRIFQQRNQPDRGLLQAAEDLSLLYSIDGVDVSNEGSLARVGAIRGIGALPLYEALVELRQRGVVQSRGRFRAILPQAIANPLAAHALDRIPAPHFDRFCQSLTPQMLKSVSRRLGFLHDSATAKTTVERWLRADGPIGDLIADSQHGPQIVANVAPVAPEAVLAKLETELADHSFNLQLSRLAPEHHRWIRLIKAIGYDAHLFDRVACLLARFIPADPETNNTHAGCEVFSELFHFSLSGTHATPGQRRAVIRQFAASDNSHLRDCAQIALRALLTRQYMSMSNHDFGARPRNWGWSPKIHGDIWDWFETAIDLVVELAPEAKARVLLADALRSLWHYPSCRPAFQRAATAFGRTRPWIEGWIACRAALRYDGKDMLQEVRAELEGFMERLKPVDSLNQARAVVLNPQPGGGGWDFADGEDEDDDASKAWKKADLMARQVGRTLAAETTVRAAFVVELLAEPRALRAFQFGQGLAEGAEELWGLWHEVLAAYEAADPRLRNASVLGGFVYGMYQRDPSTTAQALDAVIENASLLPKLPFLQSRIGVDALGIDRLRKAIARGGLAAADFHCIANRSVSESPPELLAMLLGDLASLPEGVEIALEILQMYFFCHESEPGGRPDGHLVSAARTLLPLADFKKLHDYGTGKVIYVCLDGVEGQDAAEKTCKSIRSALDSFHVSPHNSVSTLKALLQTQPFVALDAFLQPTVAYGFDSDFRFGPNLGILDPVTLDRWALHDPAVRYPLLGRCIKMFSRDGDDSPDISPPFLSLLEKAPDKKTFLGDFWDQLHPRSWSGSLAHVLSQRKLQVIVFAEKADEQVRSWVAEGLAEIDRWIEHERTLDRAREESFE